ncbi:MAG: type II secretion system protein [Phycisphaeraceae bacterium]|nr:type II secretion system protein [Phycisphaeraceae bacterium]
MDRTPPNRPGGFTLVETLAVIGIVALLVGLTLPALAGARNSARATLCLVRLRTLGQVTFLYAADWKDQMPRSSHSAFSAGVTGWTAAYLPVLGTEFDNGQLALAQATHYRCPLDRREFGQTYAYNVYFELGPQELEPGSRNGWRRIDQTPRPCRTVLFGELLGATNADHAMAHFWRQFSAPPEIEPARHARAGGSGYAFLDGQVGTAHLRKTFDIGLDVDNWNPVTAR